MRSSNPFREPYRMLALIVIGPLMGLLVGSAFTMAQHPVQEYRDATPEQSRQLLCEQLAAGHPDREIDRISAGMHAERCGDTAR